MASYDKPKLLKMLEQRRAAHAVARDLSERLRDARGSLSHIRNVIHIDARSTPSDVLDRLLNMPIEQARQLPKELVEKYEATVGKHTHTYSSHISYANYMNFIEARGVVERLQQQQQAAAGEDLERFAICDSLCEAVQSWGFKDPMKEI